MVCVLLSPMNDSLKLTVEDGGRKAYYEFGVSSNRGLVGDPSTGRTYVVPVGRVAELERLLGVKEAAVVPRKALIATRPAEDVLQPLLASVQRDKAEAGNAARDNGSDGKTGR
jgi:hypothetical protein